MILTSYLDKAMKLNTPQSNLFIFANCRRKPYDISNNEFFKIKKFKFKNINDFHKYVKYIRVRQLKFVASILMFKMCVF